MRRARGLALFGLRLARGGALMTVTLAVVVVLGFAVVGLALHSAHAGGQSLPEMPLLAAKIVAWEGGALVAFAASFRAIRRDVDDGVRTLVAARAGSPAAYLWARSAGLSLLLAAIGAGATLLTSGVALALVPPEALGQAAWASAGAVAYALAASVVLAPVGLATLGARGRLGGYLWFVAVFVLPSLAEEWTDSLVPRAWHGLLSIPGALSGLLTAFTPQAHDGARALRALLLLGAVCILALAALRRQLARLDAGVAAS
jgi:hypothetical protein